MLVRLYWFSRINPHIVCMDLLQVEETVVGLSTEFTLSQIVRLKLQPLFFVFGATGSLKVILSGTPSSDKFLSSTDFQAAGYTKFNDEKEGL